MDEKARSRETHNPLESKSRSKDRTYGTFSDRSSAFSDVHGGDCDFVVVTSELFRSLYKRHVKYRRAKTKTTNNPNGDDID